MTNFRDPQSDSPKQNRTELDDNKPRDAVEQDFRGASDRYDLRSPIAEPPPRRGNTINGFLLGLLCAAIVGLPALYFLSQRRSEPVPPASNSAQPNVDANAPASPPTTTAPTTQLDTAGLPAPQTLTLQANHPNGSTLRLTKLTFNEDSIVADLAITNGFKEAIKLNGDEDMIVTDSMGNKYSLAAPPDNPEITIQPGTTLKGQFVFRGRVAPSATAITLTTNSVFGNPSWAQTDKPKFNMTNIPLQGGAAK